MGMILQEGSGRMEIGGQGTTDSSDQTAGGEEEPKTHAQTTAYGAPVTHQKQEILNFLALL
jgi:hypothetical protein